jgi:hypothetical protein
VRIDVGQSSQNLTSVFDEVLHNQQAGLQAHLDRNSRFPCQELGEGDPEVARKRAAG